MRQFFTFIFLNLFFISVFAVPAKRIITLAPNLTEIAFAAGAGHQVVGVSSSSDFPPAAKRLPIVATYRDLDIERILSLQPDLIIAWRNGNSTVSLRQLARLKIPVYVASFKQILDIPKVILAVGKLAGTESVSQKAVARFKKRYAQLKKRYAHQSAVTVFYQVSQNPLMTLNRHTLVGQVITLCGGKNIFANTLNSAPRVSVENILQSNPDVILISSQMLNQKSLMQYWQRYGTLKAVRRHHLFFVHADWLERYGPRILRGAKEVCGLIDQVRTY